jgi:hypothetical protein
MVLPLAYSDSHPHGSEGGNGGEGLHKMLRLQYPGRRLRPLWPRDSGLEFRPWLAIDLDGSDVHPELGQRLCVSGRILRVDLLKSETPVCGLISAGEEGWTAQTPPGVRPETFVSGRRLRRYSHLGRRLRP